MTHAFITSHGAGAVPRAVGTLDLSTKRVGARSAIDRLRTSGASKLAFPRRNDAVEAIILNAAGGLTGGDRFRASVEAGPGSRLVLTTQAAERAYRSQSGRARVDTELRVRADAALHWLPQELIVFDGASLDRRLGVELDPGATLLAVESIVFGRHAMGETLNRAALRDTITIRRDGRPLYWDRIALNGDIGARLRGPAIADGMGALASVLYCGPRAAGLLSTVRALLPATGGASLLGDDVVSLRVLAADGYLLRRALVPVLEALGGAALPKSWSL